MKPYSLLFSCLCFVCLAASGQSRYKAAIYRADSLAQIKDYSASVSHYKRVFTEHRGNAADLYNAACASALAGEDRLSFRFLARAIEQGWSNQRHMEEDSDLESLRGKKQWVGILAKMQKIKERREAGYNKVLYDQLLEILEDDQGIRRELVKVTKESGPGSSMLTA